MLIHWYYCTESLAPDLTSHGLFRYKCCVIPSCAGSTYCLSVSSVYLGSKFLSCAHTLFWAHARSLVHSSQITMTFLLVCQPVENQSESDYSSFLILYPCVGACAAAFRNGSRMNRGFFKVFYQTSLTCRAFSLWKSQNHKFTLKDFTICTTYGTLRHSTVRALTDLIFSLSNFLFPIMIRKTS